MAKLKQEIYSLCKQLESEFHLIGNKRKGELQQLSDVIKAAKSQFGDAKIIVICTHNSRRSHLGQIWLQVATSFYNIDGVEVYSGGTEATEFNSRMIKALSNAGFHITKKTETSNPEYTIQFFEEKERLESYFSKQLNDKVNPQQNFIAIMVCDSADTACPVVVGCFKRLSLPYKDPKDFDDSPEESKAYTDKVKEIGREMLYAVRSVI